MAHRALVLFETRPTQAETILDGPLIQRWSTLGSGEPIHGVRRQRVGVFPSRPLMTRLFEARVLGLRAPSPLSV
jgi:hypothetical protein